jgi:hypothetical protein
MKLLNLLICSCCNLSGDHSILHCTSIDCNNGICFYFGIYVEITFVAWRS